MNPQSNLLAKFNFGLFWTKSIKHFHIFYEFSVSYYTPFSI